MPGTYTQETLTAHFDATNRRLAAIEAQLELISNTVGVAYARPLAEVPEDVIELARAGDKLGAIKRYRELTGANMDQARDVVVGI